MDTIKTEYHPRSKRKVKIKEENFENYHEYDEPKVKSAPTKKPWSPFGSKSDFEFAEIAQDAHLNNVQVDRLLKLFQHCLTGKDKLNLKNSKHLKEIWDQACTLLPGVSCFFLD